MISRTSLREAQNMESTLLKNHIVFSSNFQSTYFPEGKYENIAKVMCNVYNIKVKTLRKNSQCQQTLAPKGESFCRTNISVKSQSSYKVGTTVILSTYFCVDRIACLGRIFFNHMGCRIQGNGKFTSFLEKWKFLNYYLWLSLYKLVQRSEKWQHHKIEK